MKKSLLISAAAVLIAGPAFSQGTQMPERAPAPQQSAPAEKVAPPATTGQSEPKGIPSDAQVPAGQSRAPDEKLGRETTGQGSSERDKPSPGTSSQAPSSPSPTGRSPTTGQGAASTSASLTTEQRSKISASFKQQDAPRANNVNFNTEIGTAIPGNIRRAPLPATVIDVYPVWRGYEYVMVGDEILIIDPMTLRIVAVIEA
jgi:hypothetical protein